MRNRIFIFVTVMMTFSTISSAKTQEQEPGFSDGAKNFEAVKKMLLEHYVDKGITEDDLYRAATQGMLQNIDQRLSQWNRLLTPSEYHDLADDLSGSISGVGIMLTYDEETGTVGVIGTVPESPADKAGIQKGDRVLKVNGKTFKGKDITVVVNEMRGKEGDKVSLTILRDADVIKKDIVRKKIAWEPVNYKILPDRTGLLTIRSFIDTTPGALKKALDKLKSEKIKTLIVDLRNNMGGSLDRMTESAGMLIENGGPIFESLDREGRKETIVSKGEPILPGVKTFVLIDNNTASGAEIMAGALRKNLKATLIGNNSRGKWSVQNVDKIGNGYAVKYTIRLFSPPGETPSVETKGLVPEIEVPNDKDVNVDKLQYIDDLNKRLEKDLALKAAIKIANR